MRVKVRKTGEGVHHSESVVEIDTATGVERLVIATRSLEDGSLLVGAPLATRGRGQVLVELPREAMSGASRVWVREEDLIMDRSKVRAA